MEIRGRIERGVGKGSFFTQLDWVVAQCQDHLDFKPYPGTLNVVVREDEIPRLDAFFAERDCELVPDNKDFCSAEVKRVRVNGISGAVIIPEEKVRVHGKAVIEIISGFNLRETLELNEGDEVRITEWEPD